MVMLMMMTSLVAPCFVRLHIVTGEKCLIGGLYATAFLTFKRLLPVPTSYGQIV